MVRVVWLMAIAAVAIVLSVVVYEFEFAPARGPGPAQLSSALKFDQASRQTNSGNATTGCPAGSAANPESCYVIPILLAKGVSSGDLRFTLTNGGGGSVGGWALTLWKASNASPEASWTVSGGPPDRAMSVATGEFLVLDLGGTNASNFELTLSALGSGALTGSVGIPLP
jgi:hypothetical protein